MRFDPTKQRDYDILCALRGPDSSAGNASYYAKRLCTSSIRWLCGMDNNQGGAYCARPSKNIELFGKETGALTFLGWEGHYRNHIVVACNALKRKLRGKPEKLAELKLLTDFLTANVHNFR